MKKYISIIILILILVFIQVYAEAAFKSEVKLSKDQQKLVDNFGHPDIFMIAMGEEGRLESWTYFKYERSFDFLNGKFLKDRHQKKLPENFSWPRLKPTQFKKGMSEKQLEKILRNKPTSWGVLKPEVAEGIKIYDYYDQVKAAFENGRLIYIQTLPVPVNTQAAGKKQGGRK